LSANLGTFFNDNFVSLQMPESEAKKEAININYLDCWTQ